MYFSVKKFFLYSYISQKHFFFTTIKIFLKIKIIIVSIKKKKHVPKLASCTVIVNFVILFPSINQSKANEIKFLANHSSSRMTRGQFFDTKKDLAGQSSLARLSLSLTDSLVFCLRLICPTNPRDPHTLSMSQASGITLMNGNRINNIADYRNKS